MFVCLHFFLLLLQSTTGVCLDVGKERNGTFFFFPSTIFLDVCNWLVLTYQRARVSGTVTNLRLRSPPMYIHVRKVCSKGRTSSRGNLIWPTAWTVYPRAGEIWLSATRLEGNGDEILQRVFVCARRQSSVGRRHKALRTYLLINQLCNGVVQKRCSSYISMCISIVSLRTCLFVLPLEASRGSRGRSELVLLKW